MGLFASFIGLFATQKTADTALSIVERFANKDMTDKEKSEFVLQYVAATKHQSPARRIIAFMLISFWIGCGALWLVFAGIGNMTSFDGAAAYAGLIMVFMKDNLLTPVNLIVSFYFATHMLGGIKK